MPIRLGLEVSKKAVNNMPEKYDLTKADFAGWATRYNIKCTDGRTIMHNAFKDCDGKKVPLVWNHQHNSPASVVGYAILQHHDEGMRAYGFFNNNEMARYAHEDVIHGDVDSLSIYANKLKQQGGNVMHGIIREVSLVLAGANIGAYIDTVAMAHSESGEDEIEEAVIYNTDDKIELVHSEESSEADEAESEQESEAESVEETEAPTSSEALEHADEPEKKEETEEPVKMAESNETVQDVFDSLNEKQKKVVYYIVGQLMDKNKNEGEADMKHNAFENDTPEFEITREDRERIMARAKTLGSLKEAVNEAMQEGGVLCHAVTDDEGHEVTYGIANIDYLFPDYKELNDTPDFIKRDDSWVAVFNNGVKKTPFARIKTTHANITMDEARARGYTKGAKKISEVFALLRRQVDPQTIYKKQEFDRDDIIDVSDNFNMISWVKGEMQEMLREEVARAALIGDGREPDDPYKISTDHIKPIYTDAELYTVRINVPAQDSTEETAKEALRQIIRNRKKYKGSGSLTAFMSEDWLSEFLLLEDGFGHSLYKDEQELARKMRVQKIVTVPQLEGLTHDSKECVCIMLDLRDYTFGSNRLGQTTFFDDFDIDFNKMKYLYETRLSGMLTKPYSAMVVEIGTAASGGTTTGDETTGG